MIDIGIGEASRAEAVRGQVRDQLDPAVPGVPGAPRVPGRSAARVAAARTPDPDEHAPRGDVISVPEAAGREALRRLLAYAQPAVAPGPVALTADGRVLFHVAPGGCEDLPELLDWLDWGGVQLDLVACPVPAGPSGPRGPVGPVDPAGACCDGRPERTVEWLHPADAEPPELVALLATIATACHRLAVMRGSRTGRDLHRPG